MRAARRVGRDELVQAVLRVRVKSLYYYCYYFISYEFAVHARGSTFYVSIFIVSNDVMLAKNAQLDHCTMTILCFKKRCTDAAFHFLTIFMLGRVDLERKQV